MLGSISIEEIRNRGSIRDADVARLQAAFASADIITREDADALIALHATCPIQDPQWSILFVEMISDYIIHVAPPEGYVVGENARWLIERIGDFGSVETSTELMLLVHVLEAARWTPPSLAAFALDQVRRAIQTGRGPLRAAAPAPAGTITDHDVYLVARLISAFGGEGNIAITKAEADSLLDIHRAIAPGHATPAWQDLLVRAVGNAVLAAIGHGVPPRREIAAPFLQAELESDGHASTSSDEWTDTAERDPAYDIVPGVRIWATAPLLSTEEVAVSRLERQRFEIITNEVIEEATETWLMTHLAKRVELDTTEQALVSFIAREASQLPPDLSDFAARVLLAA
ncbi:MAG: hypothetical protein R3D67_19790 [Hyphomicrobiaceae bacterium]